MASIREAERDTPVVDEVDVCVIGGSCTGVFAAVTAARMGMKAAVVEAQGLFGGVATAALVSIWHSDMDTVFGRTIIGGLTREVIDRLSRRDAVVELPKCEHSGFILNTAELAIELDELVTAASVRPFLHARFAAPVVEDGRVVAAIIEDKTGRRAIRARVFIDATGDGDLIARVPYEFTLRGDLQPPTTCAHVGGSAGAEKIAALFGEALASGEVDAPHGFSWSTQFAGAAPLALVAGTRAPGADCSDADSLTQAEIETRRQIRAIMDWIRARGGDFADATLAALPASIGIRETRHCRCLHTVTEEEVLNGTRFDDAIANGSYRVDVHHSDKPGLTFRYLDGREVYVVPGAQSVIGRWRDEKPGDDPTFYQIPYRSLVPRGAPNVLVAGRLMDADRGAYGAVRVMVNCNQTGEAAGAAASLSISGGIDVADVDTGELRSRLADGGSVII